MPLETQMPLKFETSTEPVRTSRKANWTSADLAFLQVDNEAALLEFGLWDLEKKKEQFLTIDRF